MTQSNSTPSLRPKDQGLYSRSNEHDACGVGAVVNIKGEASHDILAKANEVIMNLHHRGAAGADNVTGDGGGVLFQLSDEFFRPVLAEQGVTLPKHSYGAGVVFLPQDDALRAQCQTALEEAVGHYGLDVICWRDVPTDNSDLGEIALAAEPVIRQIFVDGHGLDPLALDRKLFLIRNRCEKQARATLPESIEDFYINTLSCRTILYKGMFMAHQLFPYFPDLTDPRMTTAMALVHQRYSTNTFPNWQLAQPFRLVCHNGEINTLSGNRHRMKIREPYLASEAFGEGLADVLPVLYDEQSDSASFDQALELLLLSGRSLPHSLMMMMPEAFGGAYHMSTYKRAFYEYHASIMEPWDGPAAMVFTDGTVLGGTLDRNGLRPCRYTVTKDGLVVLASETGVIEFPPSEVIKTGRLQPGKMFLVDTAEGRIIDDNEIKGKISRQAPYRRWLNKNKIELRGLLGPSQATQPDSLTLTQNLQRFGYTREELKMVQIPMAVNGQEPIGSMGNDTPLAVLSDQPKPLFNYFRQKFAQVTNPPIDPLREGLVMSLMSFTGKQHNLLEETPEHCKQLKLAHPILTNNDVATLKIADQPGLNVATIDMCFDANSDDPAGALQRGLDAMLEAAETAIEGGATILVLSDRNTSAERCAIPSLLGCSAMHHGLEQRNLRGEAGIVIESGEPRETHHFCVLLGFGANAINPYLLFDVMEDFRQRGKLTTDDLTSGEALDQIIAALKKGILKTMSKMGISTVRSYQYAQLFEAIGLNQDVIGRYFSGTASRIGGVGLEQIAADALTKHTQSITADTTADLLDFGGDYHVRKDGENHLWSAEAVAEIHQAVRGDDYAAYKRYAKAINDQSRKHNTLRGLFDFVPGESVPLDEVEPASEIVKRFCTGAMSYGSISKEAHETMCIAMNRLGGMSNTGEGGEDPIRYQLDENGDSLNSAIKQVASGRFGVTIEYLAQGKEIQIKMAQGAKPGEGGQLPGHKVSETIAKMRYSTPGVTLISPPPHHDIYSIEDLAQLIFDLKCSNPTAKVSVKLVSEVGVGTVAAGVAKGQAAEVLISGHDGGTGASPLSSIKHCGGPWELGLAETQQTLVLNGLRDRIRVQTDGQLKTGRDIVIAALLGADQYGFGTGALVSLGCLIMRKCHHGTCPVGIATQRPELRKKFAGQPEHLMRYLLFIAEEARELMAELGYRSINDMIGHVERLSTSTAIDHYKAKGLDLSAIFHKPDCATDDTIRLSNPQEDLRLAAQKDWGIIEACRPAIDKGTPISLTETIRNQDRTFGTILSSTIAKQHGQAGLPDDTISINLTGSAGQSFGAFLARGVTLRLVGSANDYVGKGLSGGKIIISKPADAGYPARSNIIVGNTLLYGATGGELYANGLAGERFAVRNSGATAVVEGVGDHGCEYMTGGKVVVLGETGVNFAAGMSGGLAYVYDTTQLFDTRCNLDMVDLEFVHTDADTDFLFETITKHYKYTNSSLAKWILDNWAAQVGRFVKVFPVDYRKALERMKNKAQRADDFESPGEEVFSKAK